MIRKLICTITLSVIGSAMSSFGQNEEQLQAVIMDTVLTNNANAVVRLSELVVEVNSVHEVRIKRKLVITVLNEKGRVVPNIYDYYDPGVKIKKQHAVVYNALGSPIKKYKKNDFIDQSVSDGNSLVTDNRVSYIDYTPTIYPYTVLYESELESNSSAFVPSWFPIIAYNMSLEKATYQLLNPSSIPFRKKESGFSEFNIMSEHKRSELKYVLETVPAVLEEEYSPAFAQRMPMVRVALDSFALYGVEGRGKDWSSFGKWQFDNLITGKGVLPQQTIDEVAGLLQNVNTTKEKAKRIYEYVQEKTRYVGVQLGIGGWMPMEAGDVDKLGYGDCKALSNYTKALMDSQGISAYYSVVYGGDSRRDIDVDFASMQGNHAILNIPSNDGEDFWLECTNQDAPFDFIAGFTDDRDVLVLTPEGGVIKHTKRYPVSDNLMETKAQIIIRENHSIMADVNIKSKGARYGYRYQIPKKDKEDRELYYKDYWKYLNELQLTSLDFQNNKQEVVFTEEVSLNLTNYMRKVGDRFLVNPNFFNREYTSLPRYENRKTSLVIPRGFVDTDVYEIKLPKGYSVGGLPDAKKKESQFGTYEYSVTKLNESTLVYQRKLQINEGEFAKQDYEGYRQFREQIKKGDNEKIVLKKL